MTKKEKDILDKLEYDLARIVAAANNFSTLLQYQLKKKGEHDRR